MLAMSTAVENTIHTPASREPVRLQRSARTLIAWMRPEEARAALAGPGGDPQAPEYQKIVADARAALANRAAGVDQNDVIIAAPPELDDYTERLRENAASIPYFAEGWSLAIARVCALQANIAIDDASQRSAGIDPDDVTSIAAVTLTNTLPTTMGAIYNQVTKAWVFSSANPNLRVVGEAQGQAPGARIFGFAVALSPSFMQVASYNGRYLLRDGYHRAYGLLARGISKAPVLAREFDRFEDLRLPPGLLPQDAYLGSRPPTLGDYLNRDVSAATSILITQKVVVIQALEVATLG
jgi:hypothetical protein